MGGIFFTSDPQLGRRLMAGLRGFGEDTEAHDTDAHDTAVADAWRKVVRKDGQVWVLGDVAVSKPTASLALIAGLPGEKHLISGNAMTVAIRCTTTHTTARGEERDHALMVVQAFLNHADTKQTQHYLGLDQERTIRDALLKDQPVLSRLAQTEQARVLPAAATDIKRRST